MGLVMRAAAPASLALVAGVMLACGESPETPLASRELLEMRSDMTGYDTDTYVYGERGVRAANIHSDTAFYYQGDSIAVHMVGVKMELYHDQGPTAGSVRATVTADQGRYDPRTQGMHALGHVVLVMAGEGRRVESGELYYEPNEQRIWSDSASTYYHEGQVTRGTCFKSDLTFKNYNICNIRGAADVGGPGGG